MAWQMQTQGRTRASAGLAGLGLCLAVFIPGTTARGAVPAPSPLEAQIAAVKVERSNAISQVKHIVNQPVARLNRTANMVVVTYPGWFDPGTMTPDFNTADVSAAQESPYEGSQYVTSDLNPGVVFLGRQLVFNRLTKYFVTDRSVPKKKLTKAELLEITRLYRIIGHCDQQLFDLLKPRTIIFGLDLTPVRDVLVSALLSPRGGAILGSLAACRYILVASVFVLLMAIYGAHKRGQVA